MTDIAIPREQMMAHYGKSFHWAAMVLPAQQLRDAKCVYAFCRYIDDIVDEEENSAEKIAAIKQQIKSRQSTNPIVRDILSLQSRLQIKTELLMQLIDGVYNDVDLQSIMDEAALLRYSYGVASTVGLLMCAVFHVTDKNALRFAIDLGLAMQLTNIARDVQEDAERGRVYLPQAWFKQSVTAEDILSNRIDQEDFSRVHQHLLRLADRYYASADFGLAYLPFRARLSIIIASRVYAKIGQKIKQLTLTEYFASNRIYTTTTEKISASIAALRELLSHKKYFTANEHNHELHDAIEDLVNDVI